MSSEFTCLGVVAYCMALLALKKLGLSPASTVYFQSVVEEECTGNGALACCNYMKQHGWTADACIIPEPLGKNAIITGQVGVMWVTIRVLGKSTHALETSAGINAIETAFSVHISHTFALLAPLATIAVHDDKIEMEYTRLHNRKIQV